MTRIDPTTRPGRKSPTARAALLALAFLTACVEGTAAGRKAEILGGAMQVGLAAGFCIDQSASREGQDSLILLMGRCNSAVAETPAIITVSVGPSGSESAIRDGNGALAAFFTSEAGRKMLSRDGRARDVTILRAFDESGVFTMQVRDRAVGDYWRAVTAIRGRLITVSVAGPEGAPMPAETGRQLLARAVAEMIKANAPAQP